ncbi:MAG: sugar porter family MFS transporter [Candidatus Ancillula sp.]|jgi:sugar porter (SP) family MFS transporter|nr:sugar porter family MFS transporter [Candidatus Ancillula sp.]
MKIKPGFVYLFGALGGLLFGIDSGLTGGVMSPARNSLQLDAGWEVIMANVVTLGAGVVALFAGVLNDKFGRKKMLIAASFVFVVGALFCSVSWDGPSLTFARFVLGAGIGVASATVPSYLAELAPAAKRSGIATLFQFAIVIGLNIAYVADYLILPVAPTHVNSDFLWMVYAFQEMLGFAAIPAVILLVGAILLPESPRFLAKAGRIEECKEVLLKMRKGDQAAADAEFAEIDSVAHEAQGGFKDLLTVGKKPLIAVLGLAFFQQMVGINAAFYYGPIIAGSVLPHPQPGAITGSEGWATNLEQDQIYSIIFGIVNVLMTVVTVLIMNKLTSYKKTLHLGAGIMCFFSLLFVIQVNTNFLPPIGSIVLVCLYICGFAFSWGPVMWNIIGEIFPLGVRGVGSAVGAAANWFSNFIVMSVFGMVIIKNADGVAQHVDYGFAMFAVGCILAIAFTHFVVPETKNRSLEDIEEGFRMQKAGAGDNLALGVILTVMAIAMVAICVMTFGGIVNIPVAWGIIVLVAAGFVVATVVTALNAKK